MRGPVGNAAPAVPFNMCPLQNLAQTRTWVGGGGDGPPDIAAIGLLNATPYAPLGLSLPPAVY